MNVRRLLVAVVFTCLGTGASSASAQVWSFGGTLGWPYNFYQDEHIPYFSLHPPVYYSMPVPRTYGWSPWAYPPGVMTPEVADCEPQVIENPHVEGSLQSKRGVMRKQPPADRSANVVRPKVILNPFVDPIHVAAE
jgi:hypothetical protein